MYRLPRPKAWPPTLDLSTVRETLQYMHGDLQRVPGLEKAAAQMAKTIAELDAAERAANAKTRPRLSVMEAKFMPRRLF